MKGKACGGRQCKYGGMEHDDTDNQRGNICDQPSSTLSGFPRRERRMLATEQ